MRPRVDMLAVDVLRAEIPQFEPYYLDLREIYGEDLTPQVVFNEFAEFVETLVDDDDDIELIERCLAALETVVTTEGVDALETVGYSFLDTLRPDVLEVALEFFGPATEGLLRRLGAELCELSGEVLSPEDIADIDDLVARGYLTSSP